MSRFLFVCPPLVGHVAPAIGVAEELQRRGHEVAWVVHEVAVAHVLGGEGTKVYPAGNEFLHRVPDLLARHDALRGAALLRFFWEDFLVPLAVAMVDPVRAAVDDFAPDLVVTDQHAFAGAVVATERGLPWAVSASTTVELLDPFMPGARKISAWYQEQLDGLYDRLGLPELAAAGLDPRYSPHLVLQYSTPELVGPVQNDLSSVAFVGPVLRPVDADVPFPWEWLERHERHVLVSLGSLIRAKGVRFLTQVMEATAGQPYGVVLVGDGDALPTPPDNVLVRSFVPQIELLGRVDMLVNHAGQNSTVEALMAGIPLVCAPIQLDEPITAAQVVRAGAGRRLSFARARPRQIREAIDAVLHDRSYRAAARRVGDALRATGGAPAAATHLEALVPSGPLPAPPTSG